MDLVGVLLLLVVVAVLVSEVTPDYYQPLLVHKRPPPLPTVLPQQQQQQRVTIPHIPIDKCQMEEKEKIQCGAPDISAEQCDSINCCFSGQQCYYGKAGEVMSVCFLFFFNLVSSRLKC